MKEIVLVDTNYWKQLLPLTYTRSIADLRIGIFTIKEKWETYTNLEISVETQSYIQKKYGEPQKAEISVNSAILPDATLVERILKLQVNQNLFLGKIWLASNGKFEKSKGEDMQLESSINCNIIEHPEHLFVFAGQEIVKDFQHLVKSGQSAEIASSNRIIGNHEIYFGAGVKAECTILNASEGPIYIGKNVEVMEGSMIRGPVALGDKSIVKMGTKIYGNTAIGPGCKVGGEINNSVIIGNSNKSHTGFLGNSVIGEWCNLGAGTTNSNLKNNYSNAKIWDYSTSAFRETNRQFVGLIMGDHCKTGIGTMFSTAATAGVSCNIFGYGFQLKFIPSFTWGGGENFEIYRLDKALETAEAIMKRRGKHLNEIDREIMIHIFKSTATYRSQSK